jgi:hypothetical protein
MNIPHSTFNKLRGKHGLWFGWWQFSRCENSGAQRSAGAAESGVCLEQGHALRCLLRRQTEPQRNSVHQPGFAASFQQSTLNIQYPIQTADRRRALGVES